MDSINLIQRINLSIIRHIIDCDGEDSGEADQKSEEQGEIAKKVTHIV